VPITAFGQANEAQFYVTMSRARRAMYLFTDSKTALKEAVVRSSERVSAYELLAGGRWLDRGAAFAVLDGTTSGGVTINDSISHYSIDSLAFGGIGPSGMGAYRGKTGFLTFSHARSIYRQSRSPQAEHFMRPPFGSQTRAFLLAAITME
jgi:acyl-CoA reductase-like NAD-dependent aldehyde dehydrogenase